MKDSGFFFSYQITTCRWHSKAKLAPSLNPIHLFTALTTYYLYNTSAYIHRYFTFSKAKASDAIFTTVHQESNTYQALSSYFCHIYICCFIIYSLYTNTELITSVKRGGGDTWGLCLFIWFDYYIVQSRPLKINILFLRSELSVQRWTALFSKEWFPSLDFYKW
jgi:hypothetical protein